MQTVPLKYEERLAQARSDQELDDIRDRISELVEDNEATIIRINDGEDAGEESAADDEEKDATADLVLNEALFILRDLAETLVPTPESGTSFSARL